MTSPSGDARPGLPSYAEADHMDAAQLVTALRELLGAKLVAYLGEAKDTQTVRQWANGKMAISCVIVDRLRIAYQAARLITTRDSREVAQSWFQGRNAPVDDDAPARALREEILGQRRVIAAARQFAATG